MSWHVLVRLDQSRPIDLSLLHFTSLYPSLPILIRLVVLTRLNLLRPVMAYIDPFWFVLTYFDPSWLIFFSLDQICKMSQAAPAFLCKLFRIRLNLSSEHTMFWRIFSPLFLLHIWMEWIRLIWRKQVNFWEHGIGKR